MNIGTKSLASLIRTGDYFVIGNNKDGNTVTYSPDGSPDALVMGSFGICTGVLIYRDADTTEKELAVAGGDVAFYESELARAAEQLAQEAAKVRPHKARSLTPNSVAQEFIQRLVSLTQTSPEITSGVFEGPFTDLVNLVGWDQEMTPSRRRWVLNAISAAEAGEAEGPAIVVTQKGRQGPGNGAQVSVEWDRLARRVDLLRD